MGKAVLFSAAVLGVTAFVASTNPTSASARTRVTSNKSLSNNYNDRNYLSNGRNALYNKAGVLKGAKVVAGKTTLSGLKSKSDAGQSYFRGYRVAKLSNGSYYMKVVSFDKQYRGWIYAGKSNPASNTRNVKGGLTYTSTFKQSSVPSDIAGTTYNFKSDPLTYVQPDWTQYRKGRNKNSTSASKKDALKVTGMGTKTNGRDSNATYYYVEDATTPSANGWVKASNLVKAGQTVVNEDQVKVNYVTSDGQTVSSHTFTNPNYKTQTAGNFLGTSIAGQVATNVPAGYSIPADHSANDSAISAAQYGGQINFTVTKNQANLFSVSPKYSVTVNTKNYSTLPGDPVGQNAVVTSKDGVTEAIGNKLKKLASATATNAKTQDQVYSSTDIQNAVNSAGLNEFYILEYTANTSGRPVSTASATGQPNASGLLGGTNSLGGSSDLSSILGATAFGDSSNILGGLTSGLSSALSGITNAILGGTVNFRVVHVTFQGDKVANNVKLGSTVTLPYSVESTKSFRFNSKLLLGAEVDKAAAGIYLNQRSIDYKSIEKKIGETNAAYKPNDLQNLFVQLAKADLKGGGTDPEGVAFPDSAFSSSTTSIDSLLSQYANGAADSTDGSTTSSN
ncbi:hypothetical protein PL11_001725 [Lentilactobacillus curieae]|uniref:S-layer protein n=1 Tax=Lentilactobacillus curieae TaxID=1138822 RepID=A0A1S6QGI7_9LACO|nr:hypothetical protein PL11_001725 [Lentilactobacillus curieae]